jgi:trehalose 6-phosphate phosphatase
MRSYGPMEAISVLAEAPERAGVILDVDGTLAPIVPRPEDAAVPAETRAELERLAGRYRLLAFVSGRMGADARRIVGVENAEYVGVHGLELAPEAERWRAPLHELATSAWNWGEIEDKGLTVSFHYRNAADQESALIRAREIAEEAGRRGLSPRFGRKVLEVRPPVDADKGTAVRRLLREAGVNRALFAGDDTTDLDAFRGLREAALEVAVCVAVASEEGPEDLQRQADLVVDGPAGVLALLREL